MMEMSGQSYLCSDGETFDSVALLLYGDEKYAAELMCANPALVRRHVLRGGDVLYIPIVEAGEAAGAAPWKEG
ncbi:MAG: tail protein X [Candidatus Ventricola sp.]